MDRVDIFIGLGEPEQPNDQGENREHHKGDPPTHLIALVA